MYPITCFVAAATTKPININAQYTTTFEIDNVNLKQGDLVLVKDQHDPTENGVYYVRGYYMPLHRWNTMSPTTDNKVIKVENGHTNKSTYWKMVYNTYDLDNGPVIFDRVCMSQDEMADKDTVPDLQEFYCRFHVKNCCNLTRLCAKFKLNGLQLEAGDAVLISEQGKDSGIYIVNDTGCTRHPKMNDGDVLGDVIVHVEHMQDKTDTVWELMLGDKNCLQVGKDKLQFCMKTDKCTMKQDASTCVKEHEKRVDDITTRGQYQRTSCLQNLPTMTGHCGIRLDDVDIDNVTIKTDHTQGWGSKPFMHRFAYEAEPNKLVPLNLAIEHPSFTGHEFHPAPVILHHAHHPLFGSVVLLNQDLNDKLSKLLNQLADKAQMTLAEHVFVTDQPLVYSVKCDKFMDGHYRTLDMLTCANVNGVLFQPTFVISTDGSWRCLCKIIVACID